MSEWVQVNGKTWVNLDQVQIIERCDIEGDCFLELFVDGHVVRIGPEDSTHIIQTILKGSDGS